MTGGTDRVVGLGYHDKGWPTFEYALAMMIKVSNTSGFADWPQVLDLGKNGDAQYKLTRPAPAEPLAFFGGHTYGEKRYTNGADRDKIVAPKCLAIPAHTAAGVSPGPNAAPFHAACRFRETTFELLAGSVPRHLPPAESRCRASSWA